MATNFAEPETAWNGVSQSSDSAMAAARRSWQPTRPSCLADLTALTPVAGVETQSVGDQQEIRKRFPHTYGKPVIDFRPEATGAPPAKRQKTDRKPLRIGVVLSGGQASGGHNVITGLYDALKEYNNESVLVGFLNGPRGVMRCMYKVLESDYIDIFRNSGGFDMIASGRDKIKTEADKESALQTVQKLELDGLVVIGGDDSNTNAAVLAEYFRERGCGCSVVGCPKTIDGDLQNEYIEISFGFDTATKTYSEMISNIARDALSARKAWHFIKLMGRDASHVTLECALQTRPNITLIGEAIKAESLKIADIRKYMADIICKRAASGKNYGVVLIPEGVIQFIQSIRGLVDNLNGLLSKADVNRGLESFTHANDKINFIVKYLGPTAKRNFLSLPQPVQAQMLLERDPHGNLQVSKIPTEELFVQMMTEELKKRKDNGTYTGKFNAHKHFFGYEGRSGLPSNFDANYCYALGRNAVAMVANSLNGYMSRVYNLLDSPANWKAGAVPITMFMNMEVRHGHPTPVILKALVNPERDPAYQYLDAHREEWAVGDCYTFVGPRQFFGPPQITDTPPTTTRMNKGGTVRYAQPERTMDISDSESQTDEPSDSRRPPKNSRPQARLPVLPYSAFNKKRKSCQMLTTYYGVSKKLITNSGLALVVKEDEEDATVADVTLVSGDFR